MQVTLVTASQLNVGRSKQTTFVNEREEVEKNHVADKLGHACAPKKLFLLLFSFLLLNGLLSHSTSPGNSDGRLDVVAVAVDRPSDSQLKVADDCSASAFVPRRGLERGSL